MPNIILSPVCFLIWLDIEAPDEHRHRPGYRNLLSKLLFAVQGFVAYRDWAGYKSDSGITFTKNYVTFAIVNYNMNLLYLTFGYWIEGVKALNQNNLLLYGHQRVFQVSKTLKPVY